jgi:hypothetical protein
MAETVENIEQEGCQGWVCGTNFIKGSIPASVFDYEQFVEWLINRIREGAFTQVICERCGVEAPPDDGNTVVIENPDYIVMTYRWTTANGQDLDAATTIVGSGVGSIDGAVMGWRMPNSSTGTAPNYVYNNTEPNPDSVIKQYMQWAGDNMQNGVEEIMLDLTKLRTQYGQVNSTFNIELYGNWFESKGNGLAVLEIWAYKGGTMTLDLANHKFINTGGTTLVAGDLVNVIVNATGKMNWQTWASNYSHVGYVKFEKSDVSQQAFTITIHSY